MWPTAEAVRSGMLGGISHGSGDRKLPLARIVTS